jgi:iron complex transport system permease protein
MAHTKNVMMEDGNYQAVYATYVRKKIAFVAITLMIILITVPATFAIGYYNMDLAKVYGIIWNYICGQAGSSTEDLVVMELRVPRILMATFVGIALAVSGAVMQSILRNPLADPYTTGVSSGASLGASVYIVLGFSLVPFLHGQAALVVNAFLFSLIPAFFIVLVSVFKKITATMMILTGIGVMYIFSAITQLLKIIASPHAMSELYMWELGSLSDSTFDQLTIVIPCTLVGIFILFSLYNQINVLSCGDKAAVTMGVNPWRLRIECLILVSFITSVAVSFTGTIGFIGLVAPQIVRMLIGSNNRYLIPASAAMGALFMVLADCASRMIVTGGLPVGVITSIVGSPIFLYMLIKQSKSAWD